MLLIQSTILLANLEFHTHIKQADVYNLLFVILLNCTKRTEATLVLFHPAVRAPSSSQVPSEPSPVQADTSSQPFSLNAILPFSGRSWLFFSFPKFLHILLLLHDCHWIHTGSAFASQLNSQVWTSFKTSSQDFFQKRGKDKLSSRLVLLLMQK